MMATQLLYQIQRGTRVHNEEIDMADCEIPPIFIDDTVFADESHMIARLNGGHDDLSPKPKKNGMESIQR